MICTPLALGVAHSSSPTRLFSLDFTLVRWTQRFTGRVNFESRECRLGAKPSHAYRQRFDNHQNTWTSVVVTQAAPQSIVSHTGQGRTRGNYHTCVTRHFRERAWMRGPPLTSVPFENTFQEQNQDTARLDYLISILQPNVGTALLG